MFFIPQIFRRHNKLNEEREYMEVQTIDRYIRDDHRRLETQFDDRRQRVESSIVRASNLSLEHSHPSPSSLVSPVVADLLDFALTALFLWTTGDDDR